MVPFSEQAFSGEYHSYATEWLPAVNRQGDVARHFIQPLDDFIGQTELPLQLAATELQRFWRLPVQYFFNQRLKVFFNELSVNIDDEEPYQLDNLARYLLRDELLDTLLQARLKGEDESEAEQMFIREQRVSGRLPVAAFGEIELAASREQTNSLRHTLWHICQQPLADKEISLDVALAMDEPHLAQHDWPESVHLTGWLGHCYQAGLVRYRSGALRSQDWLSAWIDHLCLALVDQSQKTHLVGFDKKEGVQHKVLMPVNKQQAQEWLSQLVSLYYHGLNQPLAYFPKTAMVGMQQLAAGKEDVDSKMENTFSNGYYPGEVSNHYIGRVWPEWHTQLALSLRDNAQLIWLNLLAHSEDYQQSLAKEE
jgi:exodeoxyribonuclease V gamma subunit